MVIITVTKWRKKLALLLIGAVLLVGVGAGVQWIFGATEQPTMVPPDELKKDVLSQPVKVQGQPAKTVEKNEKPAVNVPKTK